MLYWAPEIELGVTWLLTNGIENKHRTSTHVCTERVDLLSTGPPLSPEAGFRPVALSGGTLCAPLLIGSCSAQAAGSSTENPFCTQAASFSLQCGAENHVSVVGTVLPGNDDRLTRDAPRVG